MRSHEYRRGGRRRYALSRERKGPGGTEPDLAALMEWEALGERASLPRAAYLDAVVARAGAPRPRTPEALGAAVPRSDSRKGALRGFRYRSGGKTGPEWAADSARPGESTGSSGSTRRKGGDGAVAVWGRGPGTRRARAMTTANTGTASFHEGDEGTSERRSSLRGPSARSSGIGTAIEQKVDPPLLRA